MQHLPAWARNRAKLIAASLLLLGALLMGWAWISRAPAPTAAETSLQEPLEQDDALPEADMQNAIGPTDAPVSASAASTVIVYISGAVQSPDVYELPSAARLKDLVLAAGGLAADADADHINLAERLTDGQHIHIPRQGDPAAASDAGDASGDDASGAAPGQGNLVNINTASAAELDSLPGIGQAFAERIVAYRVANGPFKTIEDLRNVKGIGAAVYDNLAALITVGP